jgi:acetoin utilization deacetylase AcuC-like enzyme
MARLEAAESPPAGRDLLEAVHAPEHVERIERLAQGGGGGIDMETIVSEDSWVAACHAAGGAAGLVDVLMEGAAPTGASLHRPPDHYADAQRAMGFCLVNNLAIAARHALDAHGFERVLVLDWDVHHGNGINDLFAESLEVLFCSLHEWPLYPGTGPAGDVGRGVGEGYTVHTPLQGESGDATWSSVAEHVVATPAREYAPQLILLSAGFDAHAEERLVTTMVSDAGFTTMAGTVRRLGAELEVPVGVVLAGGYALDALARCVVATLEGLTADEPSAGPGPGRARAGSQGARAVGGTWAVKRAGGVKARARFPSGSVPRCNWPGWGARVPAHSRALRLGFPAHSFYDPWGGHDAAGRFLDANG